MIVILALAESILRTRILIMQKNMKTCIMLIIYRLLQ